MEVKEIIQKILEEKSEKQIKVDSVYLVGCGGSLGALYPAKEFLSNESKMLKCGYMSSNEFVHSKPANFGASSVLIVVSHQGNTPETVAAARYGKEAGAAVIALTYAGEDTPLSKNADITLRYTFGPEKDIADEKTMLALKLAVELLHQLEGYSHYQEFCDGVKKIHGIVERASTQVKRRAKQFAEEYKDENFIYVMGSGAAYGSAYMESICILMEMQWINSASIHTGEYFHGPFEVTDASRAFILQVSEGKTRELDERAKSFLEQYAKRYIVLDAKELGLCTIDSSVIDYFNHSLFTNVYDVYNRELAEARQHPLSVRRYMWKIAY